MSFQNTFGWETVFYFFMGLNILAILAIAKRCLLDLKALRRYGVETTPLLDAEHDD